jgi:hypothetical protein
MSDTLRKWQEPDDEFLRAETTEEFIEGQAAYHSGAVASHNPYKKEPKHGDWLAGWNYEALDELIHQLEQHHENPPERTPETGKEVSQLRLFP